MIILAAMLGTLTTIISQEQTSPPQSDEKIAACLAKRHPKEVDRALERRSIDGAAASLRGIPSSGCTALAIEDTRALEQRGLLFAAMYRQYGPQAGRSAANIIKRWTPSLPADDPRAGWYVVSDCLVDRAPDAARKLILAADRSEEENRQLTKVTAELPKCLPAKPFRISRALLKSFIAETVYEIDFAYTPGNHRF
jgi:hypothetical protein